VAVPLAGSPLFDNRVMAKGFRAVRRDEPLLLPPDLHDWLPADHQVWFVLDAVARLDTSVFAARARLGSVGRAAYDPDMLLALLIWAYAGGVTSSRQIERRCREDVAFMVISGLCRPDHATIARFRAAHDEAFVALFGQVLGLCGRAGMGGLGHVAVDGTKIAANASMASMADEARLRRIARELVEAAAAADAAEDAIYGDARGDELPEALQDPVRRRELLDKLVKDADGDADAGRAGKRRRAAEAAERVAALADELTATRLAPARRRLAKMAASAEAEAERAHARVQKANDARAARAAAGPIPGTRPVPPDKHSTVARARRRAQAHRDALADLDRQPPPPGGPTRNLTDGDCRIMPTRGGFIAGYNTQLAVTADHLILAVSVVTDTNDQQQFTPMLGKIDAAVQTLRHARTDPDLTVGTVLADAGYNSRANLTTPGPDRLIAQGTRRQPAGTNPAPQGNDPHEIMTRRLATDDGKTLYRKRAATVEPVNAHLKDRRGLRRFTRRGLTAANAEAHLAAAVTNLLRLATTHARPGLQPA
jgi:transposase